MNETEQQTANSMDQTLTMADLRQFIITIYLRLKFEFIESLEKPSLPPPIYSNKPHRLGVYGEFLFV